MHSAAAKHAVAVGFSLFICGNLMSPSSAFSAAKKEASGSHVQKKESKKMGENQGSQGVKVTMVTSFGTVRLELDQERAPKTVENFVKYVKSHFYDKTIFHRVMPGFMIQGGGFDEKMVQKKSEKPVQNEAKNGLKNDRGTVAMARLSDPDSASNQFFINLVNNDFLNYGPSGNPGYTVFGKVTEGLDVVDQIAKVKTGQSGMHSDVPLKPVVIESITLD